MLCTCVKRFFDKVAYENSTTFRQTIPKHEFSGPEKIQNGAKERRKEKQEGEEGN